MAEPAIIGQPSEEKASQGDHAGALPTPEPCSSTRPDSGGDDAPDAVGPHEDADRELRTELKQLRRAMQTRSPIDRAMGVLMAAHRLTEDEAWNVLVTVSQHTNTKLYVVAGKIVASVQADVPDARLHKTLGAALKRLKAR